MLFYNQREEINQNTKRRKTMKRVKTYEEWILGNEEMEELVEELKEDNKVTNIEVKKLGDGTYVVKWNE